MQNPKILKVCRFEVPKGWGEKVWKNERVEVWSLEDEKVNLLDKTSWQGNFSYQFSKFVFPHNVVEVKEN